MKNGNMIKKKVGTLDVFCNGWLFLDFWDTRVSRVHGRIIMKIYSIQSLLHFGTCFVGKEGICSSKKKVAVKHIYIMSCVVYFKTWEPWRFLKWINHISCVKREAHVLKWYYC